MKYKITFILTLKDRHEETLNWINKNVYKEFFYLVLDGSLKNYNQRIFSKFKFKNLNYIRCKKDLNAKNYYSKLYLGSKKVKTQFVMVIDNDDYINPKAINECINFLKNNKNFSFVGGYLSGVNKFSNKYFISDYKENDCSHLQVNNNKRQIINILHQYKLLWYSVYRTALYKKVSLECKKFSCKNYVHHELLHVLLSLTYGNFKFLENITYIRRTNPIKSAYRNVSKKMIKQGKNEKDRIFNLMEKLNKFDKNISLKKNDKTLVQSRSTKRNLFVRIFLFFLRKFPFKIKTIISINNILIRLNF
tara:strand:- start:2028 stop:2942 length:915 start_codon:yes stop_codon:yes gene_type:complete